MRFFPLATIAAAGALALMTQAAMAQPLVSADWLRTHLHDSNTVVIDIRPAAQYQAGHIPGAVGADYDKIGWRAVTADGAGGALPPIAKISALIGGLGVSDASHAVIVADDFAAMARVYWTFKVLGHTDVSLLDGGWRAWHADATDQVSTAPVRPVKAVFTAHYDPAIRAVLPEVEQAVANHSADLVDARPPGQWYGTAKTSVVKRFGHLPGATWIDQTDALQSPAKLKDKAALATLFATINPAKPAISYCNTGHLAATDWFVMSEVLHKKGTRLYDGSMSEWSSDASRPMVVGAK
jgi:thiosulfate/3-mercaptopyruvate sulfurtransferase